MQSRRAQAGPGHFRWNIGGWFGSQLGGTAWMLVGAAVLARPAREVAWVWLACFAVPNAVGVWLWLRRGRLRPYPALQALLATCGLGGVAALVALHALRPGLRVDRPPGVHLRDEPEMIVGLVVVVVTLMIHFHHLERQSTRGPSGPRHRAAD